MESMLMEAMIEGFMSRKMGTHYDNADSEYWKRGFI
jgi:hypothetical protein